MAESKVYVFTEKDLHDTFGQITKLAAQVAIESYKNEIETDKSRIRDRRLRNTKLLLRNYHMLKEHAENSVFGLDQMEERASDILESLMGMGDKSTIVDSIKRSATRTAVIVAHIETMLELYGTICTKSQNQEVAMRRHDVLVDKYLSDVVLSNAELAEKYMVSKETISSDVRIATESLSALLFGVDGLNVR